MTEVSQREYFGLFPVGTLADTDFICNNPPASLLR